MATGQTLLDTMELVNEELQLQSGEADVTRGLVALNRSQDWFEGLLSSQRQAIPNTPISISILANVATTAWPTGYLRIDTIQLLDPVTGFPLWNIDPERTPPETPVSTLLPFIYPSGGRPTRYWGNGTLIYWDPLPKQNDTARVYGFVAASDLTAGATFAYPDYCLLPVATFAAKLMKLGLGDPTGDLDSLAKVTFETAIKQMTRYVSDHSSQPDYRYRHLA